MLAIWRVWKSSKHCSGVNDMAEQHEKALVPQIRFTGFTDPWEQRKLSSTCEQLSRTINPLETPNEEFTEYSMPAFDNNETAETVIGNSMNSLRKIVDRPCLLVNKLNVRKKRIWHVPRPEANAVCSSEFVPFSSHSSDLSFIKISLLSERITAYLESCSSGSSNSQKRVTPEIIMSSEIIAPSLAEQRRIGAFFDRLDSLITLHQRKYDKLCVLKKSMLDKMFPKGGSLYPEIRFAGFTDPWEQRKLSSTCEQLSRTINPLETPNEEFTEYSMPAFDNNETAETVIGNSMNSLRKIVDRPCLLVNKLNVRKKRIWHVPRPEANAVCSSEFVPFSSHSSDLSFIKISLLSERITAYLESCSSGSSNSQKRVTPEIIMSSEIIAPSLAEQRRIGAFFDRLDSLITLHQRKLELLRNIKKSMLDKMFV
ncbi:restriction endonuclease subunit S [Bifidobacterium adolescentis]|nr:restriction endonuclease subunit S [Bifidobacterium adolescentis]KAB5954045.1 restriction endonuclease subunit S [Bifidobacterium adolescentis]